MSIDRIQDQKKRKNIENVHKDHCDAATMYANHCCPFRRYHPSAVGTPSMTIPNKIACKTVQMDMCVNEHSRRITKASV